MKKLMTEQELKQFEDDFWEETKLPTTINESATHYQSAEDMLNSGNAVTIDEFFSQLKAEVKRQFENDNS